MKTFVCSFLFCWYSVSILNEAIVQNVSFSSGTLGCYPTNISPMNTQRIESVKIILNFPQIIQHVTIGINEKGPLRSPLPLTPRTGGNWDLPGPASDITAD